MNYLQKLRPLFYLTRAQTTRSSKHLLLNTFFKNQQAFRLFSATHSIQQSQINDVINGFYEKFDEQQMANATTNQVLIKITKQMDEILDQHLSYQQFQAYSPIAEELAFYTLQVLKKPASGKPVFVSVNASQTLVRFGTTFDIQNKEYWRLVNEALQTSIDEFSVEDQFDILTNLKQFGLLKNQILSKSINSIEKQLTKLKISDLIKFMAIYSSEETASAIMYDYNLLDKLDFILSTHMNIMSASEYSAAIQSLSQLEPYLQGRNKFQLFLQNSLRPATNWLNENDLDLDVLGLVAHAYVDIEDQLEPSHFRQFIDALENCVITNCERLKSDEASDIIQSACTELSAEVVEILDRIIGRDINNIPVDSLIPNLLAFHRSEKARDKIIDALLIRIDKELYHLSATELTQLVMIYSNANTEVAEAKLDQIEPYLLNKITALDISNLADLIECLYSQNLTKRYTLLDEAENLFIANANEVPHEQCAELLYFFATNRFGSRLMISILKNRLDSQFFQSQDVSLPVKMQALVSLNMVGGDKQLIHETIKTLESKRAELSRDDVFLIDKILSEIPASEVQFDELKASFKGELRTRIY